MELGDDDWNFSQEELDTLERDALRIVAERKSSSATASISSSSQESYFNKVPNLPPSSIRNTQVGVITDNAKELQKVCIKLILHSSGKIAAKFTYNEIVVSAFRSMPQAWWSGKERLWMFPMSSLSSVEKILSEIKGISVELEKLDPLVHRAIVAASAVPDLRDLYDRMPSSVESKLLPFQRDGVKFVLQHGGRALLADEMGLGKTLQAIAFAACFRDSWPVLVITPSSLRLQWASMIKEWLSIPSNEILVVLSQCSGSNKGGFTIVPSSSKGTIPLDGLFNIISYDVVPKLQHMLMNLNFKIVIADESHYLKNAQAKRTIASIPVLQKAQYVMLLSGTPALSRPIELFKQLEALHPDVYKNVREYGERYCKGGFFGLYQGASNHDELHNMIKATTMIRRLKKDVLSELPVKRRQQVFLDIAEKDMRQINALFRELEIVKTKIKACASKEDVDKLKFSEKNLINKIYNDSAEAKIPAVKDYLETVIEAGCKFLIFAHHQSMIEAIHEYLLKKKVRCIRIDGGTTPSLRHAMVSDFQEKDDIKAAVLSIKAGGVGLTLTAASTVFFAELSWTPGDIIQAEDRAHRIGQVSSVNVYFLLANDTVDDIIWDVVQSKLENLGQMLDGQENTLQVSESQGSSSPMKQKRFDLQPRSSLGKQKTLDSFMKRCQSPVVTENSDVEGHLPKFKIPRS
ncbi:SWI/SNF-related matrix-associated actin-dependent regulator of chromatin subfamily A-like protein 1 isoform X2 [Papaver somniferum]|uniref:SWI/SNF-related matrix-associated actin-dependent regulator of chromatin subfamily A-like protein 1 isoform X2 n=1 Tax=Papaver somniferum TaxID=3469 RepID=UPI000E6FC8BA|nr:SWI/SNF-related matrix-associated actin-dependent regulator of chromatin subfamily A-like protein 1 isoform X2 [Papaver somniferum]